jgi:hypothetical protein
MRRVDVLVALVERRKMRVARLVKRWHLILSAAVSSPSSEPDYHRPASSKHPNCLRYCARSSSWPAASASRRLWLPQRSLPPLTPARFASQELYDLTPLPDSIPKVKEVGASSAPLMSAAYFIGARCKAFNDDYMKCKEDAQGRGELECMREGRKVTRCARSVYEPALSLVLPSDYCP